MSSYWYSVNHSIAMMSAYEGTACSENPPAYFRWALDMVKGRRRRLRLRLHFSLHRTLVPIRCMAALAELPSSKLTFLMVSSGLRNSCCGIELVTGKGRDVVTRLF